ARGKAPMGQVLRLAVVYVLGIAAMYSTLGLVAAFTGGLFGGFLQSPWVLGGVGVLLVRMALSMFRLYQLQAPPAPPHPLGRERHGECRQRVPLRARGGYLRRPLHRAPRGRPAGPGRGQGGSGIRLPLLLRPLARPRRPVPGARLLQPPHPASTPLG